MTTPRETSQTPLAIDFLIVGAGISGLACAIALRRVGHRVTVLEKYEDARQEYGPGRLPPNLSKILYHWGLAGQLASIGLKSDSISVSRHDSGELLGQHLWHEELLKEARGDFYLCHLNDLRELLYTAAVAHGAKVRLGAEVTVIDSAKHTVTLSSGEVLSADVIIGADGPSGPCRQVVLDDVESNSTSTDSASSTVKESDMNLYSAILPISSMATDSQLRDLYEGGPATHVWFGSKRAAVGLPMGGGHYGIHVFGPSDGNESTWEERAPVEGLRAALESCEPRLRSIGKLITTPPTCVPIELRGPLDNWVANRLLLIGSAAHALPAGAIQDCAMVVEDGAVLGKLFSHLRSEDQIESFLYAFQDLRLPRCTAVHTSEAGNLHFMTVESAEFQTMRDQMLKAKRDAGINIFGAVGEEEETPEWAEIKMIFGYDAEDEADNWWVQWGLLRERARGVNANDAAPAVSSVVVAVADAVV